MAFLRDVTLRISVALVAMLAACSTAPRHFIDTHAGWRAEAGAMLDAIGEPAPKAGEPMLRFLWCPSFHGSFIVTVARDGDVAFLRYRCRDLDTREWGPPQIVFLDDPACVRLLAECRFAERDWRLPGIVADGASWYFEGTDGLAAWSAYRHSPEQDSAWFQIGARLVELAQYAELTPAQLY